jgi:hypothetical protein
VLQLVHCLLQTGDRYTATSSTRLSDHPECTGRYHKWYPFKAKFEGTANGQGYVEVLGKCSPGDSILEDKEFLLKSKYVYSVLKLCTAYGMSSATVATHEKV